MKNKFNNIKIHNDRREEYMDAQNIRKWLAEMDVYEARSIKRSLNEDLRVKADHDCTSCTMCDTEFGTLADKLKQGRQALKHYLSVYRRGVFSKDGLWYPDMSNLSFDWVRDIADDEDNLINICSELSYQGLPILDDSCIPYEHTSDVIREVWCESLYLTRNGGGTGKHSAEPSVVSKLYTGWRQAMLDQSSPAKNIHLITQLEKADSYAKYIIKSEDAAAYALWLASKCTLRAMSEPPYNLHLGIAVAPSRKQARRSLVHHGRRPSRVAGRPEDLQPALRARSGHRETATVEEYIGKAIGRSAVDHAAPPERGQATRTAGRIRSCCETRDAGGAARCLRGRAR